MAKLVGDRERSEGAHGIHEKRMRPVKRIDISAALPKRSPPRGLHGARHFKRQFIKIFFAFVERDFALAHQSPKISVGRNIIETMIVHADVRHMRRHHSDGIFTAKLQKLAIACCIELQQR